MSAKTVPNQCQMSAKSQKVCYNYREKREIYAKKIDF